MVILSKMPLTFSYKWEGNLLKVHIDYDPGLNRFKICQEGMMERKISYNFRELGSVLIMNYMNGDISKGNNREITRKLETWLELLRSKYEL